MPAHLFLILLILQACASESVQDSRGSGSGAEVSGGESSGEPTGGTISAPEPQGGGGASDTGTGGNASDGGSQATYPARYPSDQLLSPINPYVRANLQAIATRSSTTDPHVFMKIGASGTVSTNFLHCFADSAAQEYTLDLDGRDSLESTIDYFRMGDAQGTNPFARETLAAEIGKTAEWAITGDPSPALEEILAINPRFAFVNYGTNDMNMGATFGSALRPFYESYTSLLDLVENRGIIPIITGLNPRSDNFEAAQWVPTYNAVVRGLSEARQIPFIDLYGASSVLVDLGLLGDGLHGNVYSNESGPEPCVFTAEGLEYNYNNRNLLSIQSLDRVLRVVELGEPAPDGETGVVQGGGTIESPYLIDTLPFTHKGDTSQSLESIFDEYPSCGSSANESGSEVIYRIDLSEPKPMRFVVLDRDGVDIDIHVLTGLDEDSSCLERDDTIVDRTLGPGTYFIVLDTFVSGTTPEAGDYLFAVLECDAADPECD